MPNTTKSRADLKSYFVKNAIITAGNFADLIDGQLNQSDDGVFKLAGEPLSVVAAGGEQKRVLRLYSEYPASNPDWLISLKPAQDPSNAATNRPGFGLADGAGNTRLFLDAAGNLGLGTNDPQGAIDVRIAGSTDPWKRFVVTTSSAWGDANASFVTIGAGGAAGIMLANPHVPWYAQDSRASIRYGRVGGANGTFWDVGARANGSFSFNAVDNGGLAGALVLSKTGDLQVLGAATIQGAATMGAATLASATIQGAATIKGAATMQGTTTMAAATMASATIQGTATMGATTMASATIQGTATMGATTMASATIQGAASMASATLQGAATLQGLATFNGGLRFDGLVANHIEADGALYRFDGQCYLTADDNLYFRKTSSGNNWVARLRTDTGDLRLTGSLQLGDWALVPDGDRLYIKKGDAIVARFSVTNDRFNVFSNINGIGPYFYYNVLGDFGKVGSGIGAPP